MDDKSKIVSLVETGKSLRITIPKEFRELFSGRSYALVRRQGSGILVEPVDLSSSATREV